MVKCIVANDKMGVRFSLPAQGRKIEDTSIEDTSCQRCLLGMARIRNLTDKLGISLWIWGIKDSLYGLYSSFLAY